ncbi:MAG: hypothetical protein GWM91_13640, partial [Actinobacteria bacterium]|nr:hypothetical protein [Actinomycetota bacterium]NIV56583.1 hypothetical protein [Actinomycetota bacterium]NIX51393.1 hypothetical protein [Actinomycetota bacterium]
EQGQPDQILAPPYEEFGQIEQDPMTGEITPVADRISQRQLRLGLEQASTSTTSSVLEAYLEFRWHALKFFDVFFGFRNIRYDNIGVDLYPQVVTSPLGPTIDENGRLQGINLQTVTEEDRGATYEGYYLGIGIYF